MTDERTPVTEAGRRLGVDVEQELGVQFKSVDAYHGWLATANALANAIEAEARATAEKERDEAQMEYADCWQEGDRLRAQLAEARATVPDRPGILDDSIEGNVQRVDAIRVLELAAASQGYPDINGPSFLRDIEEGGYTLRLTTHDERRRRNNR